MLTVRFENIDGVKDVYRALGVEGEPFGSNFVMYDGDKPAALWRMKIALEDEPVGIVEKVRFLDGVEEGDRLFFVHAMFFKLIEGAPIKLRFAGIIPELERFGFKRIGGNMEAYSNEINLHYMCGRHKG